MKSRLLDYRKWVAWIVSAAFLSMSVVSQASWQCLDGHPCPPGCSMQHAGEASKGSALPACCMPKASHPTPAGGCRLCSTAKSSHTTKVEGCTSPICIKQIKARPQIAGPAHFDFVFDFDSTAVLLPELSPLPAPEVTVLLVSAPPRAPPGVAVVTRYSPRGPPSLL